MLLTDRQWELFLGAAGRADLITDERFCSAAARTAHVDEVYAILEGLIAARTVAEWLAICQPLGIASSQVRDVQQVAEDDYLRAIEVVEAIEHPSEGPIIRVRLPVMLSASGRPALRPAPRLGADTREVLTAAGLPADQVDELSRHLAGVPAAGQPTTSEAR